MTTEFTVTPTENRIQALLDSVDAGAPLTMLNLLRYREQADYSAFPQETPCSGREAYKRYAKLAFSCIEAVDGQVIFVGHSLLTVIGPQSEHWDDVLLVQYPSQRAFLDMVTSDSYQAITYHRTAALEDSRLVAISPGEALFQREL